MGRIDKSKGQDAAMQRRHLKHALYLIDEYELVKAGKHSHYKIVDQFYRAHHICRQNFLKGYREFLANNRDPNALIPKKSW